MGLETLAIPMGGSILVFGAITLVIHALGVLITQPSKLKRYTAKQMLISLVAVFTSALSAAGKVIARVLYGIAQWWVFFLVLFSAFSFIHVTFMEYPSAWIGAVSMYNRNIGPWIHHTVVIPLRILDALLRGLLPLWDSLVWFVQAVGLQGLLPILSQEIGTVLKMATTLVDFVRNLSQALSAFVESFFCEGASCLHPERGVIDILSSMGSVREFAALGTQLVRNFCGVLAAPLDLLLYPLLDLHFSEAVHNLVNAAVQLLVVIPRATTVRCGLKAGNQFDLLMCTPDFSPFFNFVVAGMSSLGVALDHWINIGFSIVQTGLLETPPECDAASGMGFPELLGNQSLFNTSLPVAVVGLTDWMYAVTDGVTAIYLAHTDGTRAKIGKWPYGVDAGLGVAAVTYSKVHDLDVSAFSNGRTAGAMQTTAMLGCNCSDTPNGMVILCSILPMSGIPTSAGRDEHLLQVLFPTTTAASMYTCPGVDLYVKSIRWSFTRYETADARLGTLGDRTTLPTHDCIARGTCRELDASVWLVPRCGQDVNLNGETACLDVAPCMPFCMAARTAGSGRDNLVLMGARQWREGTTILDRDCTLEGSRPSTVNAGIPTNPKSLSRAAANMEAILQADRVEVFGASTNPICRRASRVISTVTKEEQQRTRVAANVRLLSQPFAITGDTLMSAADLGGGAHAVQVERLEGSESDVFSLNSINQQLPALPKAIVPLTTADQEATDRLTIPFNYGTHRVAAVNSRNYVFYASSPNADALGAYFQYCNDRDDPDKLSKFGILLKSSYSRIRIYRVSAYRRCAPFSCGQDLIRFTEMMGFSGSFQRACDEVFNASVQGLEYLNEDNIAVTVQAAHVQTYDEERGTFQWGENTTSRTYWLNPATMRIKDSVWETAIPSTSRAILCPSMQRLPRIGSFLTELANSGIFMFKFALDAALNTPGLVAAWRNGMTCAPPGGSLHHPLLANCGERAFHLDDFFDSLDDAAAIFWHSLSLLGTLISPADPRVAEPLSRVMEGMSQYGTGTVDLWAMQASVVTLARVPVQQQLSQVWATMQSGLGGSGMIQGLSAGNAGVIGWSRYAYSAVSGIAIAIIRRTLTPGMELDSLKVYHLISGHLYDMQDEFDAAITSKQRQGCAGLRLLFGGSNPYADLLYHQCSAGAELTRDLMRLVLTTFVQIPMAKCVCRDAAGQPLGVFVMEQCAPTLPPSLLPTLYMIVNEAMSSSQTERYQNLACPKVLAKVKTSVEASMNPWFDSQFKALDALGSSIDYMTSPFTDKAGRCLDFQNDPHITVIVPQPVDYFQRCAGTSRCKLTCSSEWRAFQASLTRKEDAHSTLMPVTMESLFFPGELDASLILKNAVASVELPKGSDKCLFRTKAEYQDFILAVAEVDGEELRVSFWCAPLASHSPVYRSDSEGYTVTANGGSIMTVQFGDEHGEWLAVLMRTEQGGQAVHIASRTSGWQATPPLTPILDRNHVLMRIENMWVIHGAILVDLVTRHMIATKDQNTGYQSARSSADAVHAFIRPSTQGLLQVLNSTWNKQWGRASANLMQFGGGQYWYTALPSTQQPTDKKLFLFLPKRTGLLPHKVWLRSFEAVVSMDPVEPIARTGQLSMLEGTMLAARSQSRSYILATRTGGWDWLKQIRLSDGTGYVQGVFESTPIEMSIQIQGNCNERSCEGCADVQTQRLCLAYNKCALINCVGTPVHQRRPLCGIGALLRHNGGMGLQAAQGAWVIFTEMLTLSMQLSLMTLTKARLLWPEDAFLCYVCHAKDRSAEFFSILTATVNSAMRASDTNIGFMFAGASNVDSNADAALTISSNALNAFLHQVALAPLYGMVIIHQSVMCQVSGMLATMDGSGFTLYLKSADQSSASDIIAGQCLTVGAETLANYPKDSPNSLGTAVTSLSANAIQRLFLMQIEPLLHVIDGVLAYIIGVVQSLGMLIMATNTARCNPPDFNLKDVVNCACGDHRLQITAARRNEGVQDDALWCTGVLGMIDSANEPYYVYNKFTYAELQRMSSGLQSYTQCVSSNAGGYKCPVPNDPWFKAQGVSTFNVLVKCRENFVKKRWDPAAYMLYQPKFWDLLRLQDGRLPDRPKNDRFGVQECLRTGDASTGSLAQQCLQQYLLVRNIDEAEYWMYERTSETLPGPEYTDACLVFSGPAEVQKIEQFAACVDGMGYGTDCTFPQHLWTPLSENSIPSAEQHRVASHGTNRDGLVQHLYARASALVLDAINRSLEVWGEGKAGVDAVDVEFFSVEGDVLHQTMDCIFMGPYSRIDYWPIPACREGEECLRGPFWSRDNGEGASRSVDPKSCDAPDTLPYTCGSPSRKALMRYLVKTILANGMGSRNENITTVHRIIRDTLTGLRSDWGNASHFGCDCSAAGNHPGPFLPSCCQLYPTRPLLPLILNKTFTSLNSTTVLQALQAGMEQLYEEALENRNVWLGYMEDVAPDEWPLYNWSSSIRVEEEARFDPTIDTSSYTAEREAMSPFKEEDSTLWDVCHAAIKQVFFTLPVDENGILDEDESEFDADPAKLEASVKRFTREAFLSSPLFRHYSPRHAPSQSQMCETSPIHTEMQGSLAFSDFVQAGTVLMQGVELATTLPVFHPQRFQIGEQEGGCLCGWQRVADTCIVPTRDGTRDSVCRTVPCLESVLDRPYNISNQPALVQNFGGGWYCPEFELSPHWGFLDPATNEQWLATNRTTLLASSRDLLHHGRAGVRAANVRELSAIAKARVNPSTREVPLDRGRLTTCDPGSKVTANLLDKFVDELFPAAQAVEEAGGVAYCLRFTIESARMEVLDLVGSRPEELASQRILVALWRRRCGTQLHLLHLCSSLNVFRPLVIPRDGVAPSCPHFRVLPNASLAVYATPQCLVSVNGVFYDPCRCMPCTGQAQSILNVQVMLSKHECRIRFDPRQILVQAQPLGWTDGLDPFEGEPADRLLHIPSFARMVWEDQDATGNVPPNEAWWDAEGSMTETGEFCDGVLDWWPEDWDFPVGYHVTVPCEAEDTAYRSFMQAFVLADGDKLMYQHDLMRDASLADSHFGVGGLCRSGSFGMPMPETNTVRYCTRLPVDDTEDFTLPVDHGDDPTDERSSWGQEACTASSLDLPWPNLASMQRLYQTSLQSVGTIPNMPIQSARTYPATDADMFDVGPAQEIEPEGRSWWLNPGQLCQDFTLRTCQANDDCPAMFSCRGRVCSDNKTHACTSTAECGDQGECAGVCIETALVECIMHSDCPQEKMCSGVGTCETPVIAVYNQLEVSGDNVSFSMQVAGETCGDETVSRAFTLLGSSFWGNSDQDILRAHGMCSFEDWFKYTHHYSKPQCSTMQSDGSLRLDPTACTIVDLEQIATNQTRWWPAGRDRPELMYLRPTKCDRDYERLRGFTQCAPLNDQATFMLNGEMALSNSLTYDRFLRLHANRSIMYMAAMPERTSLSTGFLGMGGNVSSISDLRDTEEPGPFVSCSSVAQCYPSDFYVNGVNRKTNRTFLDTVSKTRVPYPMKTPFICGVFGIEDTGGQGCRLDIDVLPLYRFLCLNPIESCLSLNKILIQKVCSTIQERYQPSMQGRDTTLQAIRSLFEVFPRMNNELTYLGLTACADQLYTKMVGHAGTTLSKGFYYPFMFALYEFPFDWFYQCILMFQTRIDPNKRGNQDCSPFITRKSHTISDYQPVSPASGDAFLIYLSYVQGGYTFQAITQYEQKYRSGALTKLSAAIERVRRSMFPDNTEDFSYPRCSTRLLWRIGDYGDPWRDEGLIEAKRAIIWNWHDPQSCKQSWHDRLIRDVSQFGITNKNWEEELTYPDPHNMVAQRGSDGKTILTEVKKFIIENLETRPIATVLNSDDTRGCLRFNNVPPSTYDFEKYPVPDSLIPRAVPGGEGVTNMDETIPRNCIFPTVFDPAFRDILATTRSCGEKVDKTPGSEDTLRRCGDRVCTSVPVAYRRNGMFDCRYQMSGNRPPCTQGLANRCAEDLLSHTYNQVNGFYMESVGSPPEILRPVKFEWFNREATWTFEGFQMDSVLDYERNIQPNPERTVMCEITTDAENAIKYSKCNNPHYEILKQHVEKFYKHSGSVIIPAGNQLEWPVGRTALKRGAILAFSNMNRSISRRFTDGLFNDDTVCKNDPNLQVCRKETQTRFRTMNPWLLGMFNPYEVCDVEYTSQGEGAREFIHSYCIAEGNEEACNPFREREIPIKCGPEHTRLVSKPGVPRVIQGQFFQYNLCFHRLEEDPEYCMHDQGLLGGFDGLPVSAPMDVSETMLAGGPYADTETYSVARNLYEASNWSIPDDFRKGFYAGSNPLWQGGEAPYGHIQIEEKDIGGHRIGLTISTGGDENETYSELKVAQIALGLNEDRSFIQSISNPNRGKPASEWVPTLRSEMLKEDAEMQELFSITLRLESLSGSCPLKRWMFYAGNNPEFSPTIPSAQKARHLFHRIHNGLTAHPTMHRTTQGRFLGNYTTPNGFCACPVVPEISQRQCLVKIESLATTACSLAQTIQALKASDSTYFFSFVHPPVDITGGQRKCRMSLDWPSVDGMLRDGSPLQKDWSEASSPSNQLCHVLDRFRPFQYRYTTVKSIPAGNERNTITDGVCMTARVATLDTSVLPEGHFRCLRLETNEDLVRFTCNVTSRSPDPYKPQMSRRARLSVPEILALRRKTPCSKCAPPPRFVSQEGRPIPPESSFGRLHRWSAERMLAQDLREALCNGTAACQELLNSSAWRRGEFLRNYLFAPHQLFKNVSKRTQSRPAPPAEDPTLWTEKPWVYCPTPESLRTGEGCEGAITRAEWMRSKTRICPAMVRSYSTKVTNTSDGDPMARTPFCSIDNTTDGVCLAIAEARQLVIQANCIARGDAACMPMPFVYHPASYEPSNNAWTRDSVAGFYRRLDKTACPTSEENQPLIEFARQFQRGCPANAVNLIVSFLQILRVVTAEVAMLVSTMLGMAVKITGLLIPARAPDMRQSIGTDWQFLRTKFRALLDTAGDLLVDAMLNSGELGARIMHFLHDACGRINAALAWFLNVWCSYIQQYMIQVLSGLRYAMGIMGAGFEMVQDFMDEVFQGILPAAFVSKYAQKNFKEALVEAYSRPTDRQKKGKQADVPDTANPRPGSQSVKKKNKKSSVSNVVGKLAKSPLSKALGFVSGAFMAYELISGVMNLMEEDRLRQLYPDNFTLFDLSGVVNTLDDMEQFLLLDDSCYEYQLAKRQNLPYVRFQCISLDLDSYNATTAGTTSLVSTQCWADARPTLGQNSLFACSASSTCCRTSECTEYVLCATCADPVLPGINKYGCDSLRKTCVCGQPRTTYDRCAANRQCDARSECELVSSLNSISYGTIPCANCPSTGRVMCLLPLNGFPGRCSCMLDNVRGYDICSDTTGRRTSVTAGRLCAYMHGTPTTWLFDMDELIMVPCSQVRIGVCSTVILEGRSIQMVVAESVAQVYSGRGRRLLSEEQVVPEPGPPTYDAYESEYELPDTHALHALLMAPGWNTTAAPCSTLVMAYQENRSLGILETYVLHKCGFWRYVGRQVIRRYNLTTALAGHETFLLSMDDMVYALMKPAIASALLRNPGALGTALLYHPWMKPVRALGVMLANNLEYLRWVREIDSDVHESLFGDEENSTQQESPQIHPRFRPERSEPTATGASRRLLSLQDSSQAVLQYSIGIIQNPNPREYPPFSVPYRASASSSFNWPPRFNYSVQACPLGESILRSAVHAVSVNKMYFANFEKPPAPKSRSLRANLPRWDWIWNITTQSTTYTGRSIPSMAYHWVLDLLSIRPEHVLAFFVEDKPWTLQWIADTLLTCDLAEVLTCAQHRKDLIMSTVIFVLMYAGIRWTASALGLDLFATVFLLSYPWFILWYVFGMSPTCFPMIPPCLVTDIIGTIQYLVPAAIRFPPDLLCSPPTCLRPCSELGFHTWADTLAFAICDTDNTTCSFLQRIETTGWGFLDMLAWTPLRDAMMHFQATTTETKTAARRICAWVTFIWIVPVIALLATLFVITSALLAAVFDLIPSLITLMGQVWVFYES